MLNEFSYVSKKKLKSDKKYNYGGIHGISALISPDLKDAVELIPDAQSECVLWLIIKSFRHGHFIIGSVYMPFDTSRFHFDDAFGQIEQDILNLKIKYDLPICLAGDFNAHTGNTSDFLEQDKLLADLTGCEELGKDKIKNCSLLNSGFTVHRYSQDVSLINRNGKNLLSMCQTLNLRIVNEYGSVIDYFIVCENMLSFVSGFHIEMFDPCLSVLHCPVEFELSVTIPTKPASNDGNHYLPEYSSLNNSESVSPSYENTPENVAHEADNILPQLNFKWSNEIAADFQDLAADTYVNDLYMKLDKLSNNTSQTGMNDLCQQLSQKIIVTAKQVGECKEVKKS